jgi:hypothetical protein
MWAQFINVLLGVWLIISPDVLGSRHAALTNDRIIGPLVILFSVVAVSEATRQVRWVNVLLGFWLLLAPWVLSYGQAASTTNSMGAGALVILLGSVRGEVKLQFGGGWSSLFRAIHSNPEANHGARS